MPRRLRSSTVLEKAAYDFNKRQHVATVVSTRVDEKNEQVHRDATKDHNCIVTAVVQQERKSRKERLTILLTL